MDRSKVLDNLHQVDLLTEGQIAQFKRDGMLVLPGVLDLDLCRQARDQMWALIAEHRPRMQRDDPATWVAFTEEEGAGYERPEGGGDPYFSGRGHRLYVRNGAEELLLNTAPRALWGVAEQLLGEGEVVWPAGVGEDGATTGPCLLTEGNVAGMETHLGPGADRWTGKATGKTGQLRLPKTGPVWMTGQGARGSYCTLPNSPPPADNYRSAHSEALYGTHWRLQIAAYIDDLPPSGGGLTLWPGSHRRIWDYWEAVHRDVPPPDRPEGVPKWDGYTVPPLTDIKMDTEPVETAGPVGSVVLWHAGLLHMAGQNTLNDVIRQATIYAYAKTPESVPDEVVRRDPIGDLWRDWSDGVRSIREEN
jgi:hypothetical protein